MRSLADERGAWGPAPDRPELALDTLDVWRAELSAVDDRVLDSLSPDELRRAASFRSSRSGLLWARSRGVLRSLLGAYARADPADIELAPDRSGKPLVAAPRAARSLSFNISHSGPLALYAFSRSGPVGVDVQMPPRRPVDEAAIARRALGAAQAQRLARMCAEQRRREFLRSWTRHEAALKCCGGEIFSARQMRRQWSEGGRPRPWVIELSLGAQGAAALAAERRPRALRRFDWTA